MDCVSIAVEFPLDFIHISNLISFKISCPWDANHSDMRTKIMKIDYFMNTHHLKSLFSEFRMNNSFDSYIFVRGTSDNGMCYCGSSLHFFVIYFSCKVCFWRANLMESQSNSNFVSVFQPQKNGYSVTTWYWIFHRIYWVAICCGENIPSKSVWILCRELNIFVVFFSWWIIRCGTNDKTNGPQAFLSTW